MGLIIDFLGRIFNKETKEQIMIDDCSQLTARASAKELAINTAINLLGSAISLSDFETYEKGKPTKGKDSYLLNVQPNVNTSASRFWRDVVFKLVFFNECLIVQQENQFFVADTFTKKEYAFYPNSYKHVTIKGFSLDRSFEEKDVIYLQLNDRRIKAIIDSLYDDYGELIEYSKKSYKKNNAKRGILEIPANYPQTADAQEKLQKLLNDRIQKFYNSESGAVLPLSNGIKYEDISSESYKNGTDSRDIRNLVDDVFDYVGIGFQVPPQLLRGSVSDLDSVVEAFIGLGVNPIARLIENEFGRKMYNINHYTQRTFLKVNTQGVITRLDKLANAIDILTRNGVHSIDENRQMIGKEPLNTKESQARHVTKNYDAAENVATNEL